MLAVNAVLGLVVLGVFWAIGQVIDQSRSGVLVEDLGGLSVVSAVCPGERLEAVRLTRIVEREDVLEQEVIWEITGDGVFPDRFEIGAELPGLETVVPLFVTIDDNDQLIVRLRSNQLTSVDPFSFVVGEVIEGQVASSFPPRSVEDFRARVLEATPCE